MNRPTFDELFLMMCELVALRSEDKSTKVGSVITDSRDTILSIGYNGFVRGFKAESYHHNRPQKYLYTEHAERNAIYNAAKNGVSLKDAHSIYCNWLPCADCARAISQIGISRVVINKDEQERMSNTSRWNDSHSATLEIFEQSGIMVVELQVEKLFKKD